VVFGFVVPSERAENKRLYPKKAINAIERICADHGVKPDVIDTAEILLPYKKQILLKLFSYSAVTPLELRGEEIRLSFSPNVTAEVEKVAREIRRLVVESGYRYRDVSVVLCDSENYVPQIKTCFRVMKSRYLSTKRKLHPRNLP
jgi:ATP-dependent nuclease, subunit B